MTTFNTIKRLIKRFISSFIILLLLDVTVFIVLGYGQAKQTRATDVVNQVAQNITFNDTITLTKKGKKIVNQNKLWVMVLDSDNGNQVFHYKTPKSLKKHYNLADVAQFSRFYLDDYPVFTHIVDNNLIVVGFPKDRIFKFPSNYYEKSYITYVACLIIGILITNCLYFIALYFYSTNFVNKKLRPLAQAITNLPQGLDNSLANQDDFQKIISAINQTDKELKESQAFKEEWISGVAHDIKTPLSVIISNASLAKSKSDNVEITHHIDPILVEGYYIQNVLNDLNIFARLTNRQFQLKKETVRLVPFFKEIIIQIINQGIWENFQFDFDYDDSLIDKNVAFEPNLISRVIHNVIYNSVLHNPDGCQISIYLHDRGDSFRITIKDNGVGISHSKLANLYQQENTEFDIAGVRRHGMGLKISRQIIQVHKGKLTITSELNQYFQVDIDLPFE